MTGVMCDEKKIHKDSDDNCSSHISDGLYERMQTIKEKGGIFKILQRIIEEIQ